MNRVHAVSALAAATLVIGASLVPRFSAASAPRVATPSHAATAAAPHSLLEGLEIFQLDGPHSPIGFTVSWMGLSRVHGGFDECIGTILLDTTDITRSSVSI